jgi:zinc-ribbon domain
VPVDEDPRLVCPSCGAAGPPGERFCPSCGMPLVHAPGSVEPVRETAELEVARKIRPSYAQGELVKVGWAKNVAESDLIQGLLLEEGIPSVVRRSRGFDVPDFLAAGPRDILVPAGGAEAARDLLRPVDGRPPPVESPPVPPVKVVVAVLIGVAVLAVVAWAVSMAV